MMMIKDHPSPGSESESRAHEVQGQSTSTLTHQGKSEELPENHGRQRQPGIQNREKDMSYILQAIEQ